MPRIAAPFLFEFTRQNSVFIVLYGNPNIIEVIQLADKVEKLQLILIHTCAKERY